MLQPVPCKGMQTCQYLIHHGTNMSSWEFLGGDRRVCVSYSQPLSLSTRKAVANMTGSDSAA